MNLGFDRPLAAAAAFIIIPLACYILSRLKNPFVVFVPLGAPGGVPFKSSQMGGLVKLLKVLEVLGIFLLFLSAAGPVTKKTETVWLNRGADIIFVLDVSPSMAALDMDGKSRFTTAKALITEFADKRPSDNIGLAAVGTDAVLLLPPATDREALYLRLEQLRIGELGEDTALGMGLAVAAYHLDKSKAKRKTAVLITDGENNAGMVHPETAAAMLREIGASLWVIGVGTAGEVPIDYLDPFTKVRRTGLFDSRYDTESLRRLSLAGGGTFIFAPTANSFASAFSKLDEGEITVQISRLINKRHKVSVYFLIPAILLAAAVWISRRLLYKFNSSEELGKKMKASAVFFFLFAVFAVAAVLNPKWGTQLAVWEYRRGLDTVFAIDVSRSMDIRDAQTGVSRSRLERGVLIARETVKAVPGARFAAAIGRSKGYLTVPLTWDNEAALSFFQVLNADTMTGRSTNLEALVEAAADAFQESSPAKKVIVLVSDGESLGGILGNALSRCIKEDIIVNTVALGSDTGRPIPKPGNTEAPDIISRRDAAVMRMAAEKTGGIYIDGSRDDAAAVLANHLLSVSQQTGAGRSHPEPKERRTLFIILTIIAYGISKFIPLLPRFPLAPLAAIIFIFTSCSEGKLLLLEANYLQTRGRYDEALLRYLKAQEYEDAAPYAEYGLGLTFYLLDESKAALKSFDNSQKILESLSETEHRELRFRNSYNSGIIFFEEGDYKSAAAAFKDALRADGRKIEAKRNLELSLMSAARQANENNSNEGRQENEIRELLFDFIREEEQRLWKSREWAPEEKSMGADY
ncbi:MAG: VWA domain-containing protein [Treponema sp.]|nr:VWA domain-containing protein [Treponema sp.]